VVGIEIDRVTPGARRTRGRRRDGRVAQAADVRPRDRQRVELAHVHPLAPRPERLRRQQSERAREPLVAAACRPSSARAPSRRVLHGATAPVRPVKIARAASGTADRDWFARQHDRGQEHQCRRGPGRARRPWDDDAPWSDRPARRRTPLASHRSRRSGRSSHRCVPHSAAGAVAGQIAREDAVAVLGQRSLTSSQHRRRDSCRARARNRAPSGVLHRGQRSVNRARPGLRSRLSAIRRDARQVAPDRQATPSPPRVRAVCTPAEIEDVRQERGAMPRRCRSPAHDVTTSDDRHITAPSGVKRARWRSAR